MIAGLLLAVGCALAGSVAVLLKQRGAAAAPVVRARHPVNSAIGLFGSKWWTVGWLVALGAWLLHVAALSLDSLSIVQAVISGGLVLLAILAERFFGFHLGRRQWIGLLVTTVGLTVLGLTTAPAVREHASAAALIAVEGGVVALSGSLIYASIRLEPLHPREGILLAVAAGALFGTSDIAIKHLVHPALTHVMLLVNPWTLSALTAMFIAFYASARSLQLGPAITVITFTSLSGNIIALLGGSYPWGTSETGVQSCFGLICPHLPNCSRRPPFLDDLPGRFVCATETPPISGSPVVAREATTAVGSHARWKEIAMALTFRRNKVEETESAGQSSGWYADPYGAAARRWFDNISGWSERVEGAGQAPDQTGLARMDEAAVTPGGSTRPVDEHGTPLPLSRPVDPKYMADARPVR